MHALMGHSSTADRVSLKHSSATHSVVEGEVEAKRPLEKGGPLLAGLAHCPASTGLVSFQY